MAIRLSHQTVFGQFEQLRATIEQSAIEMKAQFATGTDEHRAATQLVVLWNRCVDWRGKMAQLRALAGASPTLLQYMKDQLADQGPPARISQQRRIGCSAAEERRRAIAQ